jgi:hypothetical protein
VELLDIILLVDADCATRGGKSGEEDIKCRAGSWVEKKVCTTCTSGGEFLIDNNRQWLSSATTLTV